MIKGHKAPLSREADSLNSLYYTCAARIVGQRVVETNKNAVCITSIVVVCLIKK